MTDDTKPDNVVPLLSEKQARIAYMRSKMPARLCCYCDKLVARCMGAAGDIWAHPECLAAKGEDFIRSGEADHVLFVVHRKNNRVETWDVAYLRKLQKRAGRQR